MDEKKDRLDLSSNGSEKNNSNHDTSDILFNLLGEHDSNDEHPTLDSDSQNEEIIPDLPQVPDLESGIDAGKLTKFVIITMGLLVFVAMAIIAAKFSSRIVTAMRDRVVIEEQNIGNDVFNQEQPETITEFVKPLFEKLTSSKRKDKITINLTEAEFSKIDWDEDFELEDSLSKICSAMLSSADRWSKLQKQKKFFSACISEIGLKRTNKNMKIRTSIEKLKINYDNITLESNKDLALLRDDLFNGTVEEKYQAIESLKAIGSANASQILFDKLHRQYNSYEQRSVTNRIIDAICRCNTTNNLTRLAEMIKQCPSPNLSNYICIKLAQFTDNLDNEQAVLPLKNDYSQRSDCSKWWKENLSTNTYSHSAVDPNQITDFWTNKKTGLNKFAQIIVFAKTNSLILDEPVQISENEKAKPFDIETEYDITKINNDAKSAFTKLFKKTESFCRLQDLSKDEIIKLDILNLKRKARLLACENPLQEISVNLESTTNILEILNSHNTDETFRKFVSQLQDEHSKEIHKAQNVLQEIQINSYYHLRWLDLLQQQHKEFNLSSQPQTEK